MHPKRGGLAALGSRTESVLGYASHRIDHGVPKLKEFFFLLSHKGIKPPFAVVHAQKDCWRFCRCFFGFGRPATSSFRRLRSLLRYWPFDVFLASRSRLMSSRLPRRTLLFC